MSFKDDLSAELREKLTLIENGTERRVTKQRAFAKTLIAAAIKKDIRAVNALLACMKLFGVGSAAKFWPNPPISPTSNFWRLT